MIELSNLPACVEDIRRAALRMDPGPMVPTGFDELRARLAVAGPTLPRVYRDRLVTPFGKRLDDLGPLGLEELIRLDPQGLSAAGALFDIVQSILQRADGYRARATRAFQEVVADLYDGFLSAEDRADVDPPDHEVLAPLVKWGAPAAGPYTWPVDLLAPFGVSVGVVSQPPAFAEGGLVAWAALAHETTGHDILHADDGLLKQLRQTVAQGLLDAEFPESLAGYWADRIDETASDVLGVLNMGPATAIGLVALLRGFRAAQTGLPVLSPVGRTSDVHPADYVRGHLVAGAVRCLRFSASSEWANAIDREVANDRPSDDQVLLAGETYPVGVARRSAAWTARLIATTRLHALENHALCAIQNWSDRDEAIVAALHPSLTTTAGLDPEYAGETYAAHLVATGVMAALDEGADLPMLLDRTTSLLAEMHAHNPTWGPLPVAHGGNLVRHFAVPAAPVPAIRPGLVVTSVPGLSARDIRVLLDAFGESPVGFAGRPAAPQAVGALGDKITDLTVHGLAKRILEWLHYEPEDRSDPPSLSSAQAIALANLHDDHPHVIEALAKFVLWRVDLEEPLTDKERHTALEAAVSHLRALKSSQMDPAAYVATEIHAVGKNSLPAVGIDGVEVFPGDVQMEPINDLMGWLVFSALPALDAGILRNGRAKFRRHDEGSTSRFRYPLRQEEVAVFGDFGTGLGHSRVIARQLEKRKHPYAVHLGDVYYAGRPAEWRTNFEEPLAGVLPQTDLFLLTGNHELYSGGHRFLEYLDGKRQLGNQSQEGSYFWLVGPTLQIIGLDTEWEDHGRLASGQREWLRQCLACARTAANPTGLVTVVMTSSQPYTARAGGTEPLLDKDLRDACDAGQIHLWFWGNTHYCALFDWTKTTPFIGSCVGHGGYPYEQLRAKDTQDAPAPILWADYGLRFPALDNHHRGANGYCVLRTIQESALPMIQLEYLDWRGATVHTQRLVWRADVGRLRPA